MLFGGNGSVTLLVCTVWAPDSKKDLPIVEPDILREERPYFSAPSFLMAVKVRRIRPAVSASRMVPVRLAVPLDR